MTQPKRKKIKAARREHSNKAAYGFLVPYILLFTTFIIIPMVVAIGLSFTSYDTIQMPTFKGILNYINLLTADICFILFFIICFDSDCLIMITKILTE